MTKTASKKKEPALTWLPLQGRDRNQWLAEGEWGEAPPRIKMLDNRTFCCYRDGLYLGSEKSLAEAQSRVATNQMSDRNAAIAAHERENPDALPPGLQFTDGERAEWWRRHPPVAAPAAGIGRGKEARPNEDPATRRLRAALEAEGARGPTGRAKVAPGAGKRTRGASEPPAGGVLRVVNPANPKRAGTGAHGRWALLFAHDGKTVEEYRRGKGNMTTLANAVAKKHVVVEEK